MKMNIVEPIRDIEKIEEIHNFLYNKNKRDALLFSMGIYTRSKNFRYIKISCF